MAPNAGRRLLPEGAKASDSPFLDEESGSRSTSPGRDDFYAIHRCKIFAGSLVLLFLSAAIFVAYLVIGRSDEEGGAAPVLTNELNTPLESAELPETSSSLAPLSTPSIEESEYPSGFPSGFPSIAASSLPSSSPSESQSDAPSPSPTTSPTTARPTSVSPSPSPTTSPTTARPTAMPASAQPTASPVQFLYGELSHVNEEFGIEVSEGLSGNSWILHLFASVVSSIYSFGSDTTLLVRLIAETGERVKFADGTMSSLLYHRQSDSAGVVPLGVGDGYVYVANSEVPEGKGGVYGIYFDKDGEVVDYKALLTGTSRNCGGGVTPFNTFVSCEEVSGGQCWHVDPNPSSEYHHTPMVTQLGGPRGGRYESVAVDYSNPEKPVFFVTEDNDDGELRRFEAAHGNGWDSLHDEGTTTYLQMFRDGTFAWTESERIGEQSAERHYPGLEGIQYSQDKLYFMAKKNRHLFILDLKEMTYKVEETGLKFYGEGAFDNQPDQNIFGPSRRWMYLTEDGGPTPGVYARQCCESETYYTIFQGMSDGRHLGDETVGIALSPDHLRMYAGFQDAGIILEFTRDDGMPFG